jgi:diadenosine tetraphosphatase ApaH/serine/threonine PP2A family protein phosphatase
MGEWLFVHGSAREPLAEYVREKDPSGLSNFDEVVETLNKDFSTFRICFVGHNHKPFLATEEGFIHPHQEMMQFNVEGERLYISVGSVGQPRDGDPRSCFVVFDGQRVTYHRVAYDVDRTVAKIRASGLPAYLAERLPWGR